MSDERTPQPSGVPLSSRLAMTGWAARRYPFESRVPFKPLAEIEASQRARVRAAIDYATRHVPFYREAMRELGLRAGDFETAADLAHLPIVERSSLQATPRRFLSEAVGERQCLRLHSSGTSGRPITVYRDPASIVAAAVITERGFSIARRLSGSRRPRQLAVLPPDSSSTDLAEALRSLLIGSSPSLVSRRRDFSVLRPPADALECIERFRPHMLSGYGSYIEALVGEAAIGGELRWTPRVAHYGAAGLSPNTRRIALEELGMRPLSLYQAVETVPIAFECEAHGGQHVNLDVCPVRIVDSSGSEVPVGASGEVVISTLVERGTVLLNYRLGDLARWLSGPCPCGRTLPLISFVEGRAHDWLTTPRGERIHPQAVGMHLRAESDVLRHQVVQESSDRIRVRIVAASEADREALASRIQRNLEGSLEGATIEVEFATDLERTPGGKVLAVINRLAADD